MAIFCGKRLFSLGILVVDVVNCGLDVVNCMVKPVWGTSCFWGTGVLDFEFPLSDGV